ncbi:MAG: chromosome segregation protein SMC [Thermodesulfobacteriota bacterium]
MRLKSLEMVGFKSFVDRIVLTFPEGITGIVGPNGCGKSNIVDAILWAIGERSAKHLRGRWMEDVIFNGSEGRKPLGMAEVTLTFSNDDGSAPPEYAPYSEIAVTRRLYRSGESEFLINRVPCRLRDITDLFLDTGIGVNGYSIVEQGRVEYLIHANPEDRRFLIEEAGGIAKYKERKRLALMKMEATQQNLLRIQDIIAEVKRQILSLERQVKRAEEYKAIRKEIKELELRLALQEFMELSEKGEAARGYLKALREREKEVSTQLEEKEALIEELKLRSLQEEERERLLQQHLYALAQSIQKRENEVEHLRRERENLHRQETELKKEVKEGFLVWQRYQQNRKRAEEERMKLEMDRKELQEILQEWEILYNEFKATYQEVSDQLEREKGKLINLLTEQTSLQNRKSHLQERREGLIKRLEAHGKETEEAKKIFNQAEEKLSKLEGDIEKTLSFKLTLQEEKERLERVLEGLRWELEDKMKKRLTIEEELRQNRSRYLSLKEFQENYEGFDKGVKSILLQKRKEEKKWERILGIVADIFEPDPPYEIPLEAVLGDRLQYLIVEGEEEAKEAIHFLKRESLGRGSFIPAGVKRNRREDLNQSEGNEGPLPLLQFVKVKDGFSSLAEFLIGDVGVVHHLEEALQWIKKENRFRTLVTREGEVIERSGVISGGSLDQGLSLLERRRLIKDLEKKVREEEEVCRRIYEEEEGLQQEIAQREDQLERIKKEIQAREMELFHQGRDQEALRKEYSQIREKIEILQFEGSELKEEEQEIEEEKRVVLEALGQTEELREQKEEELQSLKRTVEEIREGTEELGGRITEKKVLLASIEEKERSLHSEILHLIENQKALRDLVKRKVREIRRGQQEATFVSQKIEQEEKAIEEEMERHRREENSLTQQRENVSQISNEWKEGEASARYLRQELEEIRRKIHKEEIQFSEFQLKLQHLQDSIKERYGVTLSSSFTSPGEEIPKEEMNRRLAELKVSIEGFGEVNLMAIEEYQELKQRYDFLMEQHGDLQKSLENLKKAISRINRTTTKRFLETFHLVNEKFKEVFVRLFKGGQASLILLDESDPSTSGVDIIAQPPGKKLQNIDLLSGGEKALVATALLFGLFMIKPTPFCLLDEMDAPLDDANINRFIELVRELSKKSQFILITHNKKTMEVAHTLYGITMETPGVSKVVSVRLN